MIIRRFLRDTRAGATAIAAAAVTVMTVGGAALVGDHVWLVDQRDALKSASEAAGIAATLEMGHLMDTQPGISDADLETKLNAVARRYVMLNLEHLPAERLARATSTLVTTIVANRAQRTVDVSTEADLGGTILSRHMPLLGEYAGSGATRVEAQVESVTNPIEVVLAIDISGSMSSRLTGGTFVPSLHGQPHLHRQAGCGEPRRHPRTQRRQPDCSRPRPLAHRRASRLAGSRRLGARRLGNLPHAARLR